MPRKASVDGVGRRVGTKAGRWPGTPHLRTPELANDRSKVARRDRSFAVPVMPPQQRRRLGRVVAQPQGIQRRAQLVAAHHLRACPAGKVLSDALHLVVRLDTQPTQLHHEHSELTLVDRSRAVGVVRFHERMRGRTQRGEGQCVEGPVQCIYVQSAAALGVERAEGAIDVVGR